MIIADGKEEIWQEWQENNQDFYGGGVIKYARTWAELMEAEITPDDVIQDTINDIAERTSDEADEVMGGITGFMYSMAVHVLASCWIWGEELRRWHNLEHQLGNEGEKANEEGTVLNTAALNYTWKGDDGDV